MSRFSQPPRDDIFGTYGAAEVQARNEGDSLAGELMHHGHDKHNTDGRTDKEKWHQQPR
jgi:hypothetical protein